MIQVVCLLIRTGSGVNNRKPPNISDLKQREATHTRAEVDLPWLQESLEVLTGQDGGFQGVSRERRRVRESRVCHPKICLFEILIILN